MTKTQIKKLEKLIILIDGNGEYSVDDIKDYQLLFNAASPKEINEAYSNAYAILGISSLDNQEPDFV